MYVSALHSYMRPPLMGSRYKSRSQLGRTCELPLIRPPAEREQTGLVTGPPEPRCESAPPAGELRGNSHGADSSRAEPLKMWARV